ncbi:MAG: PAS domain-containing protein [Clostridiales bacterium]|nr:PAS domain-containing protein [Clostridiales bacterium]
MIEKFYRRIIDGVPSPLCVVDKNLKTVFANAAFCNLFPTGHKKGSIGKVFGCAENHKRCGQLDACRDCSLLSAFENCFFARKELDKRVYMRVKTEDSTREVAFSIKVKPIGDGLYLGVIDNALEVEISRELETAKDIQQRLLPAGKWAAGKRYSFTYIPCRDIGGDLPDVYTVGNSAFGVIADVSGKGISAGMLTAFVKAAYDKTLYSPAQAISNLSTKFNELNPDERSYITVAAVRIDKDSVTYSMAGHNVPILLKTGSGITRIMLNSPPVSNWFDNPAYFEDTIPYEKGDILVLLTDGVTESRNSKGEMFGVEGAIKTLSVSKTGEDFIKNLENNLKSFCGNLNDDITAIAFDL